MQRNGTVAKEAAWRGAALRWSALTRPVARASGATVEHSASQPAGANEFAIAHVTRYAKRDSRSVVNGNS